MSLPFIIGMIIYIQFPGIGCLHWRYGLLCLFYCLLIDIIENVKFQFIGKIKQTRNLIYASGAKSAYAIDLGGITTVAFSPAAVEQVKIGRKSNMRVWRNRQTRWIWVTLLQ